MGREVPRGMFIVQGLVQLKGPRAGLTLDVRAFYDPQTNRYVSVDVSPRWIRAWKQSPKGGT